MKRFISLFLSFFILLTSLVIGGCKKKEPEVQEYVVNTSGVIYVGVILPLSGEYADLGQKYFDSINYAKDTASFIKLDTEYKIELITVDLAELQLAYDRFNSSKVTSVICLGINKPSTDAVINKFAGSGIPLVFLDNHSELIANTDNVFSLSVNYNYQCSALSAYLNENFMSKGAVVLTEDTTYNRSFADLFDSTFLSGGGLPVVDYVYDGSESVIDTVLSEKYDFVLILGPVNTSLSCYDKLREKGYWGEVVINELADKTSVASLDYEGLTFISKFEEDNENYIGSDFINVYSEKNSVRKSEISSVVSYGYDAYMLIYEVLHSFAKDDPLSVINGSSEKQSNISDITLSAVSEFLKNIVYYGVSDVISFNTNGILKTNFVYIDKVISGHPESIDKYIFSN